jgi:hypothetical protein
MRLQIALVLALLASPVLAGEQHSVPNPKLTPGDVSPNVTAKDICAPPQPNKKPQYVSAEVQQKVYAAYGLPEGNRTGYCYTPEGCSLNRLIPMTLGGTNDPKNLWVQPNDQAIWNSHIKTELETRLHEMVCQGEITLGEAQQAIATDWITAYQTLVGEPKAKP